MASVPAKIISAISINNTPYLLKDERVENILQKSKAVTIGYGDIANQVFF